MVKLRPVRFEDAETLFKWRNDPETIANSVSPFGVAWQQHVVWLRRSMERDNRKIFVAEQNGQPVGTVRIDHGPEAELSWTVAPEHRGKGIGKAIVGAVPDRPAFARIKACNTASQRIAEFAGFKLAEDGELQVWRR